MAQMASAITVSQTILNKTNHKLTEADKERPRNKSVNKGTQTAGHPPRERTSQIIAAQVISQQYTRAVITRHFRESRRMRSEIKGQKKNERLTRTKEGDKDTIQVRLLKKN